MKKTYIKPQTEIIKVDSEALLAASPEGGSVNVDIIGGGTGTNGPEYGGTDEGNSHPLNAPSRRSLWED